MRKQRLEGKATVRQKKRFAACAVTAALIFCQTVSVPATVYAAGTGDTDMAYGTGAAIVYAMDSDDSTGPCDVILSVTGDTRTMQTITWHDAVSATEGGIVYGTERSSVEAARRTGAKAGVSEVSGSRVEIKSGADMKCSVFSADLTGLKPDTLYYYYVESTAGKSEVKSFATAAENQETLSFAYMGDIQFQEDMIQEYADWGQLISKIYQKNPDLAFGVLGGDIVQSGIRAAEWDEFLKNASPVFSSIPLMSVNGNHESNMPGGKPEVYLDLFSLPQNGPEGFKEEFYSFDYGTCHVTALNSWVFSGEQDLDDADYKRLSAWIEDDLKNSGAVWNVVVMHHPVYALADDRVAEMVKENWAPIFEKYGVDLVFCGHQHVYSRSYPMTDGAIDYDNGVTYIMGNSGQKFYSSADETYQEKTIYSMSTCQVVRIDGSTMEVLTYDRDGNELDYCSLKARAKNGSEGTGEPGTPGGVTDPGQSPSGSSNPSDPGQQPEVTGTFADVSSASWYAEAVKYVREKGLMNGTGETAFSPDGSMTRGMFVTVLYRMSGAADTEDGGAIRQSDSDSGEERGAADRESGAAASFTDVPENAYYADAVSWAAENGIVTGVDSSHFAPSDSVTRQQMAAVMYRYHEYMKRQDEEWNVSDDSGDVLDGYGDAAAVAQYAREAFAWAVSSGIITGIQDGGSTLLRPSGTATRAQCAAILMRYSEKAV